MTATPGPYRWASVSAKEFGHVGRQRHLVRQGALTSACSTTASTSNIWRSNGTKPKCQTCEGHAARLLEVTS